MVVSALCDVQLLDLFNTAGGDELGWRSAASLRESGLQVTCERSSKDEKPCEYVHKLGALCIGTAHYVRLIPQRNLYEFGYLHSQTDFLCIRQLVKVANCTE